MTERVAIVGVAQTRFSPKRADANYAELAYEAIAQVLAETGLEIGRDIDNAISCSHDIWDGQTISNIGITDVIGGHLRNEEKMAMDGATAVYYGTIGILSGEFDCTLLLAHTKMSQTNRNVVNNVAFDPVYTRLLGFDYTSAAALQARRYMHIYGVSAAQAAQVVVKNLANAARNPVAFNGQHLSLDDVLNLWRHQLDRDDGAISGLAGLIDHACRLWPGQYITLDLLDEERQIGASKAQFGGQEAMAVDVWGRVLVMRMRRGQIGVIGVRPRIVPVQLGLVGVTNATIFGGVRQRTGGKWQIATRYFVAISLDGALLKIQQLVDTQHAVVTQSHQARQVGNFQTRRCKNQRAKPGFRTLTTA